MTHAGRASHLHREKVIQMLQVFGVDPGLVHTGVVAMTFNDRMLVSHAHEVVVGCDAKDIVLAMTRLAHTVNKSYTFVEDYRPRTNLGTDRRMLQALADLKTLLPRATYLDNMGVKKVVREDLMKALDVWTWGTPTHHQDLRSAARIALLGMMKDDDLNALLYRSVSNQLMPF